ncbi:hypothetical protein N657DRAFT_675181 [Parathielavia appendiculata]|uniref:Uncharacterized protein n=1 Tax=Parathielavia appendiculata TaxID=2587402 RepID=A0AAN6TQT2_9PEZI|nr:hypothetical protein N657DRAFT_675181 [Parathielavia appendiculata]
MQLVLGLFVFAMTALYSVTATEYCQCENNDYADYGRIFPGINQVCSTLSNDWCSTNCNIFGKNCDYCQYTPKGHGPDEDFHRLQSWCSQQQGTHNDHTYYGTLYCYSFENKVDCSSCGGCAYANNGYKLRRNEQECPVGTDPDQCTAKTAPDSFVTLVEYNADGEVISESQCRPIFGDAASTIADSLSNCTTSGSGSTNITVSCTSSQGESDGNSETMQAFHTLCDDFGGLISSKSRSKRL